MNEWCEKLIQFKTEQYQDDNYAYGGHWNKTIEFEESVEAQVIPAAPQKVLMRKSSSVLG